MRNNFDDSIRKAMEGYSIDDGGADQMWSELSGQLKHKASPQSGGSSAALKIGLGILGAGIIGASSIVYFGEAESNTTAQTKIIAENTAVPDNGPVKDNKEVNEPLALSDSTEDKKESKPLETAQDSPERIEVASTSNIIENDVVANIEEAREESEGEVKPDLAASDNIAQPEIEGKQDKYCVFQKAELAIKKPIENATYVWQFSDGTSNEGQKTVKRFTQVGQLPLRLSVSFNGEEYTFNYEPIEVNGAPSIDFSSYSTNDPRDPSIEFKSMTDMPCELLWKFGDGKNSRELEPKHQYTVKGIYKVTAIATSEHGCIDSVHRMVRVHKAYNLMASSVFDPAREQWMPAGLKDPDISFELNIYTDGGVPVFKTNSANQPWDGVNSVTGDVAKTGSMFIWVATVQKGDETMEKFSGTILVTEKP